MTKASRKQSLTTCILCCHEIDNVKRFDTVGVCGHTGCCSLCALRMRQLLGNASCAICKSELARVICIEHDGEKFDSFQDWGDNIGPTHEFDEASGMFFLKRDFPNLHKLRDPVCKKCGKNFSTLAALKTHLLEAHQLQYCAICLEHKKVFLQEQETLSKDALKRHNNKGTPREGFTGHPRCDFCFSRHYSTTELYDHLHKNHFECDICLHSMHIQNRYYKNYADLENHFRADHFLCEEPICLSRKFVVFKSHLDMQAHLTEVHPHIKTSRKIDVHFTIRRANHGDETNDGFEDYERFQQNGSGDRNNTINVADFPSLASGTTSGGSLFWENQAVSRPRMEDFPELGGGGGGAGRGGGGAHSFRNALTPPPTPAMMAHMNNGDSWEYPELASAAAALGPNNPLLRFVKPAKVKKGKKGGGNGNMRPSPTARVASAAADELEEKAAALSEDEDDEDEEEQDNSPHNSKSAIVLKLRQVLGSDAKYEVFREDCKAFRLAEVDIPSFYAKMKDLFSSGDFEKLFLRLMRLFPDREQVEKFFAHHKQLLKRQNQGFKDTQSKKNRQQPQQQKQPVGSAPINNKARRPQQLPQPAAAGWANALRETGASPGAQGSGRRGPSVIVHNTNTRDILGRDDQPKTTWRSSQTWQAPVPAVSPSSAAVGLTPTTTKIQSAPIDSFASLAVSTTSASSIGASYASAGAAAVPGRPAQPNFKVTNKSEFPGLPSAGRAMGVVAVTRATWDDQVQQIAHNGAVVLEPKGSAAGKKKQKKKSMTLAEMAMKFA